MHDLSLAFKPAKQPSFAPRGHRWATAIHRSRNCQHTGLKEAENSELPFARPQQRHRYRPAATGSSLPTHSFVFRYSLLRTRSVRTSLPHSGWPAVGHFDSSNPLPASNCTARAFPEPLLPVGEHTPQDRNSRPSARPTSLPGHRTRLPITPRKPPLGGSGDSRLTIE